MQIEGGAAGIAAVDRRVDLQVIGIGAGPAAIARPANCRHDARCRGSAETERVAQRDDPVAPAQVRRRAELNVFERLRVLDLDDGEIGLRIAADQFSIKLSPILQDNLNLRRPFDDVVVRDDMTLSRDEEA